MNEDPMLKVWLIEYDKLKVEQVQRIGFRDNLLYTTLGEFGAIVSFAVSNPANSYALLVIPWVCLVLGWTYVINDEKISAIGRYIRLTLVEKVVVLFLKGWRIIAISRRLARQDSPNQSFSSVLYVNALPKKLKINCPTQKWNPFLGGRLRIGATHAAVAARSSNW
jgi:hypothetical protein